MPFRLNFGQINHTYNLLKCSKMLGNILLNGDVFIHFLLAFGRLLPLVAFPKGLHRAKLRLPPPPSFLPLFHLYPCFLLRPQCPPPSSPPLLFHSMLRPAWKVEPRLRLLAPQLLEPLRVPISDEEKTTVFLSAVPSMEN